MARYVQDIGSGTIGEIAKWLTTTSITDAISGTDYLNPSSLDSYIPYTGATTDVNLGSKNLTTSGNLSLSSISNGSVLFIGGTMSSPIITEDNTGYYYDDTNNRLSVFTTLGSELTTNGTFTGSATGWTVPSGMAYSSNSVSKTSNGTGALTQTFSSPVYREYCLTYTISAMTAGTVTPSIGGFTGTTVSANGTYKERFVATSNTQLAFTPSNTARFTIDNVSLKLLTGTNTKANINTGGLSVEGNWSNGSPGTTRSITINNDGSNSWIDYRFSGTLRGSTGVNSSGGMDFYASGGNYFAFYAGNSGLTSNTLFSYLYQTAFVHTSGYGSFYNGVYAGYAGAQAPTSTLQSGGGTALKVKKITASQTLDNSATHWLCDASTAACTGTPTYACSHYTNSTDCLANDAHGGCAWNSGYDCSSFNGDQGNCESNSGCTYETADCSGTGAYDQFSCELYSGCSWSNSPTDCSSFDEMTCSSYSGSGCYLNYDYCYNYSDGGGDGTACSSVGSHGCNYDTDTGSCSDGMGDYGWFTSCGGSYDNYSCSGSYYTGSCVGTYGASCYGTSACSGIDDSTSCGAETGCIWQTALNANLPQITTCPDRTYWIVNDSETSADVNIVPYSGDTIDFTSSYVLSTYKDGVHISPLVVTASCSGFNEGACTPSGCSLSYSNCTWDSMMNECTGDSSCTGISDQMTCEGTSFFSSCYGTYTVSKNWYIWSRT